MNKQCRLHPERKAEVWLAGPGSGVCRSCSERFFRETKANPGSAEYHDVVGRWFEQTRIVCPSCAHDAAIFEDAHRELELFLLEFK